MSWIAVDKGAYRGAPACVHTGAPLLSEAYVPQVIGETSRSDVRRRLRNSIDSFLKALSDRENFSQGLSEQAGNLAVGRRDRAHAGDLFLSCPDQVNELLTEGVSDRGLGHESSSSVVAVCDNPNPTEGDQGEGAAGIPQQPAAPDSP